MDKNTWIGLGAAVLCLAFVFLTGNGGENKEVDTLLNETMAVHDEAMKTMADMNRIGRLLKHELPELDSLTPRADSIRTALRQIKHAEEGMYNWMQQYQAPKDLPAEEAKAYLEDQKAKISQNQQEIRDALEAGLRLQKQGQ